MYSKFDIAIKISVAFFNSFNYIMAGDLINHDYRSDLGGTKLQTDYLYSQLDKDYSLA